MNDAGLHHREFPDGVDRIRQPFQAVAHLDARVGDPKVLDFGEHRQLELHTFAPSPALNPRMPRVPSTVPPSRRRSAGRRGCRRGS